MPTDVTDATFAAAVLERSETVPVVVDLWAPWCGPCRTLGPMLEQAVARTQGAVELAKVNVDENPQVSATFQVQSIPAVFALSHQQVVDSFVGALPEAAIAAFVERLVGPSEIDELVAAGDELSLRRAIELQADHPGAVVALADLLVGRGEADEALALLSRLPETAETRQVAARARLTANGTLSTGASAASAATLPDLAPRMTALLERAKDDEVSRQEYLDLLETLPADDPRRAEYRRALASRLY